GACHEKHRHAPCRPWRFLNGNDWAHLGIDKPKHWRSVTRRRLAAGGHTHISRASVHHRSPLTAYLTATVRDGDESLRSKTIHQRGASPPFGRDRVQRPCEAPPCHPCRERRISGHRVIARNLPTRCQPR